MLLQFIKQQNISKGRFQLIRVKESNQWIFLFVSNFICFRSNLSNVHSNANYQKGSQESTEKLKKNTVCVYDARSKRRSHRSTPLICAYRKELILFSQQISINFFFVKFFYNFSFQFFFFTQIGFRRFSFYLQSQGFWNENRIHFHYWLHTRECDIYRFQIEQ